MNKKASLIVITSLTATFVALCAAFFSVTGIAKLFAGASFSILIMASALELGKIVGLSFLYQYWTDIPRLLKGYLTTAVAVLMLITSVGIYGYLSAAYQETADQLSIIDRQTAVIDVRKERYQEELALSQQERDRLSISIEDLNRGLAGNIITYRDAQTGQILTSTSSANRTALQQQLAAAASERTRLADRIEALTDSITSLEVQSLEMMIGNDLAAEIGPLRFVSNVTGWPIDKVVNIFAIMIVLVFDPLAIALVIAVNFLLKYKPEEDEVEKVTEEPTTYDLLIKEATEDDEPYKVYAPEEREIIDAPEVEELINEPEILPPEEIKIPDEPKKELDWGLIRKFFVSKYGGIPNWMQPDYNWNVRKEWVTNPLAVEYKTQIVDKNIST
jgi:hypothetical protein